MCSSDLGLHQPAQRTRAVDRIEAAVHQPGHRLVTHGQRDASIGQTMLQLLDLDRRDAGELLAVERLEGDHRVEAVEELRAEVLLELLRDLVLHPVVVTGLAGLVLVVGGVGGVAGGVSAVTLRDNVLAYTGGEKLWRTGVWAGKRRKRRKRKAVHRWVEVQED